MIARPCMMAGRLFHLMRSAPDEFGLADFRLTFEHKDSMLELL
jgi:hypothetical protein